MKRLFPYIAFACLTGFTVTTGLPVMAGGCSSHMNKKAGEIVGQGTGDLYEHLQNLKSSKITIYVSGMSAKSRGYDEKLLDGYTAEFVMPDVLVEESIKADSVLCY